MARLFQTCVFLTKVPKLTISPTSTAQMYYGCSQIKEVDLSGWNTSNTTDMSETFYSCRGLTEIDVTNLDTSNCSEMYGLFAGCHELKKIIGIEQLDTSKNINFTNMFSNCQKLTKLPEIDCSSNTTQTSSSNSPINNCYVLRDFGGLKGFNKRLYCNSAYSLSYESLLNIINGLADGVSGQTLYLHQDCVNQLSDDDIAVATNKGWSISPAKKITSPTTVYILSQIPVATYHITPKTYDFSQFDGV